MDRRTLLKLMGGLGAGYPLWRLLGPRAARAGGFAERVIFFYFPDGVVGPSQNGDPSKWHASGSEHDFSLGEQMSPLEAWKDRTIFFNGLSMGGTDEGSHPGGAQKLLTAVDYGQGASIDQVLAGSFGSDSPWWHLLLGVQSQAGGTDSNKFISYPVAGSSLAPNDDPQAAFSALFGGWSGSSGGSGGEKDPAAAAVLSAIEADLVELRSALGGIEKDKLDYHYESLRQLQARLGGGTGGTGSASCKEPSLAYSKGDLYDPARFDEILLAQTELAVLAMECGMTRVATIQCSYHTSELIMSRIPGTPFYDPSYDMRSHQASHYGASHDPSSREYSAFLEHGRYWSSRFAHLLSLLDARPEGSGTMLDNTICVLVTEVCDGNIHDHGNMPFLVAGGGGGMRGGRLFNMNGHRHGDLWAAVGRLCGQDMPSFGDSSSGTISLT